MKKAFYLVAVATLSFFSCQKQELDPNAKDEAGKAFTFKASIEQLAPTTKADINASNELVWATGDKIGVCVPDWGEKNQPFTLVGDGNVTSGDFEYDYDGGSFSGNATAAFFPWEGTGSSVNNYYDGAIYFKLKNAYWSYTSGKMLTPLVATLSDNVNNISFKHAGAAVKLRLNNLSSGTYKVKMTVVDQQITGNYHINPANAGTDALAVDAGEADASKNNITLNTWKGNGAFDWIFPVPVLTKPKLQFEITDNNGVTVWSKNLKAQTNDVGRGDILVMPAQTITPYEKFVQDDACTWSFCGTINGSSWQNDIPMVSDGKYWILAGMVFADGDEFKIRKDKKWTVDGGDEYPDKDSENWKFNSTNAGTKDIIFNSETKEIKVVAHSFPYPEVDLSSLSSSSININGDMSDWTFINTLTSTGTDRIRSWKFSSDSGNLYFYFVLRKNRMYSGKPIALLFDWDDSGSISVENMSGGELSIAFQPFTNTSTGGAPTCVNGTITTAWINIATDGRTTENVTTGLAIEAYGADPNSSDTSDSADYFLEVSIPKTIVTGLPSSGTIKIGAGNNWYNTSLQDVTL